MDAEFERVEPVIPVRDLDAALQRYQRLGFHTQRYKGEDRYAFANRGAVSLHLTEWREHDPKQSGAVIYLYVSDADAVHEEWSRANLPGRLTTPEDTDYGLREFAYVDPDGTLHRVGSPT